MKDNPVICGGSESLSSDEYKQECFSWRDSTWQVFFPLTEERYYSAWCPSPFPNESHRLLVVGGYGGSGEHFNPLFNIQLFSIKKKQK